MNNCLCIFGFGYTAHYVAELCRNEDLKILGTSRNPKKLSDNENLTLVPFSVKTFIALKLKPTHIIISVPPTEIGDPVLNEFGNYLAEISPTLQAIGYLSTTGVYGDHKGEWVYESSESHNLGTNAKKRLAAEKSWQDFSRSYAIPLFIFRVSGIYGPYRNALQQLKAGKAFSVFKKDQVFSRIHVEDLAKVIKSALFQPEKAGIYNVSDNESASNIAVDNFAAKLLGIEAPPHQLFEQANLSVMAREFYQSNKRVSNSKMRNILGVELSYPDYREGLTSLFEKNLY